MDALLSVRALAGVENQALPWRLAPRGTYNPDTNNSGLISFATAENLLVLDELDAFARNVRLEPEHFLYQGSAAGGPRLPSALAVHLNEYLKPHRPISGADIQVVGATTAMHDILAWAIADPGEGILISRPVYGRFELDFGNKYQVKVVYADTDAVNCFDESSVDRFEEAWTRSNTDDVKIKALVIVNPNNPLGRCYPKNTLVKLLKFCEKYRIHLISDEIYACSVFDSGEEGVTPFTSILSIDSSGLIDPNLLHVTYGLSKDFGAPGLRVGAIITRSQPVLRAVSAAMRSHNPSGASVAIATAMLEDREWCRSFINSSRTKVAAAYLHVTKGLKDIGVKYQPGSNAGFFVYIDLSPYLPTQLGDELNPEFALARSLYEAGVFLHPREEHSIQPGWFRVVYTQDPRTVTEGLSRIKTVIS